MDEFRLQKRIYYHDTDCGGVVYYANYLRYFEEARTEHLRGIGIDLGSLSKRGLLFAVGNVGIKYKSPARYGELITIFSRIEKVRPASMLFTHRITRGQQLLAEATTRLVTIDRGFKPAVMPEDMSTLLMCGKR